MPQDSATADITSCAALTISRLCISLILVDSSGSEPSAGAREGVSAMKHCAAILALGLVAAVAVIAADEDPVAKPRLVPVSWELEFEYKDPQSITIRLPGDKRAQTYWYVLYTVTNRTGADRNFVPNFIMYTDTGEILRAGRNVPALLFEEIQKRHNNPLLLDMAAIAARLLQGEDNAKDGVAIWPDFDSKARGFDIFVGGISGEKVTIKLPAPIKEVDNNGKEVTRTEVTLFKTLHLTYLLPGEAAARPRTKPELLAKQWIMR